MIVNSREVTVDNLKKEVKKYHDDGYRFVTETCLNLEGQFKIIYTFAKGYDLDNIHIVTDGKNVPSVSDVYSCALLVENEIKELFGVEFDGLVVDFGGNLMLGESSPISPQADIEIIRREKGGKNE
ncbi:MULTISPECIES: NADH-quinone oxidoreductase subunit C [Thermoanaerobacterium]|uniref:NADH-quinone oxidoreductase subunit C n=1 Tax=Thermoanaerobacterium TaxID=28895 RepID=UPI0012385866|nr:MULTISPECIES: NADH-quinone oxidoreductase subunit C [Thermoanaerobacterium]KAA5806203.1 NADH-quinone oxidoreductase subunit C [Thermoanaerobacterium thermosaccharolyticum]MDK2806571.1 ech hydrogenase subunit [Thermoanaerobacterium sp.]WKV07708.1 NADH-quinone oxidoreductase subunit C [Thermoanaerobacterium sp. CMT5567-10]